MVTFNDAKEVAAEIVQGFHPVSSLQRSLGKYYRKFDIEPVDQARLSDHERSFIR